VLALTLTYEQFPTARLIRVAAAVDTRWLG
jgi:hypothetical protein